MSDPSKWHNRQPTFFSPLGLSDEIVPAGTTLAVGGFAAARPIKITNPNKTAMLVDAFSFAFDPGFATTNPIRTAQLGAKLYVGNIPLTHNFVPILAMCPTYYAYGTTANTLNGLERNPVFKWHLPRPMYVPPNVQISAQFNINPLSQIGSAPQGDSLPGPFRFSVIGRSLPSDFEVPPEIFVPWATHTRCADQTLSTYTSGDADLINPFGQPMRVVRFIGHAPIIALSSTEIQSVTSFQQNPLTVRMTLSNGKMLVQTDTPFYNLFNPSRRYMDVDSILQAKEFTKAIVTAPDGFATIDTYTNAQLLDLTIGMIGYRVLPTPQGSWT